MTIDEAIFCEKSYIGETNCVDCKYYGTEICQSRESHRIAVKALESTAKNVSDVDCISRKQAINAFTDLLPNMGYNKKAITEILQELPPLTPQESRWISVEERLPKIADVYRVTRYYPNNVINPIYLVDACCFDGYGTWYNDNRINHERAYATNVIAWQENPEPYEPENEVKE